MVLLYIPEGQSLNEVKALCFLHKLRLKTAGPSDAGKTVGYLLGIPGYGPEEDSGTPVKAPEDPVMVIAVVRGSAANGLLEDMRKKKIQIPYKAMLTESNEKWTISALHEALSEEHASMGGS